MEVIPESGDSLVGTTTGRVVCGTFRGLPRFRLTTICMAGDSVLLVDPLTRSAAAASVPSCCVLTIKSWSKVDVY